jgi:hypothetical protein
MGKTSLVTTWMAALASQGWRGAERVFDWTFYSQGTSDQRNASADTFIAAALRAFGDPDPTQGSPWERGERLARLVRKLRCLLVLDGLEPLQYPPGPMRGKLKDPGVEALLKGLVASNDGLCIVTTREKLTDIEQHYGRAASPAPASVPTAHRAISRKPGTSLSAGPCRSSWPTSTFVAPASYSARARAPGSPPSTTWPRPAASSRSTATGAARKSWKTPKPPSSQHLHQSHR